MAKNKKSKILAMALCASVMTGIYASPVMAEELYVDGAQSVTTNGVGKTKIASLEGLREITLGDSVKITTDGKGIIRVGDAGGGNTRVFKDGFYVNTSGDDRKTSLKAGTLTLAGIDLTSAQLDIINDVITNDGAVVDVTSKAADGKTYSLNTVGKNTSGIRRAGTTDENRSTYIEETVRVNNNSGLVVYAEDGITFAAQIDRKGNVLTKGVGRFGALEGPNVRMENGVLTVNSIGETDVAKLDAEGLTLTSDTTEATLSAEQIARLNTVVTQNGKSIVVTADHFKNTNESFAVDSNGAVRAANGKFKVGADGAVRAATVNGVAIGMNADGDITLGDDIVFDDKFNSGNVAGITREPASEVTYIEKNTAVSADGIVVRDPDSGVSTKTKYDGFYVKDKDSKIVSSLEDDGLRLTDAQSGRQILNATDIADIKGIDRSGNDTDGYTTTIEETLTVSETGIAMSKGDMQLAVNEAGFAAVKGDNAINLNESGVNLSAGNDNFVSVTQNGIGLQGGTSQVIMNSNNGAVFRNGDKAVNGETVINGGTITTGSTTITSDSITTKTLNVDKIVLGDKIVDKDTGDVIGGELEIGADGSIKIDNAGTDAVEFNATKTALSANYGETSLNMDSDGFNLNYGTGENAPSLVLNGSGFAFAGSVNLGKGSDVKYTGGNYGTLAKLDATVKDIYDRTDGIYKDSDGNTVISKEKGTWDEDTNKTKYTGEGSKVVVGANGTTFENGVGNGTTNIDGSKITSDATGTISGGSGPSTNSIGNPVGSSTTNGEETVYVGVNNNTNTVNSSGMTVKNDTSTTVIDAEKVDTKTGNFSDKVTVGIQGNQTVITGGDVTVGSEGNQTVITGGDISVDNSVTVAGGSENKTTINNEGITVGDKGTSIKNDSISVGDGGYIGDGDVRSGEGVSLNDTAERVGHLENRVGKLEDRVDKVGAMAAAIANLRTMGYDPAAPTEVAVGIGQYRDETGAALGLFHYPNRDFMLSLSVSTSGDEVMGGIGATWKFGRKSPEKVAEIKKAQAEADARRAEEAKLAKAEEMKQAAKEAKVKAQQERHAKMAAEMKK